MSKKQTRRSVSMRGDLYERFRKHCASKGISMSSVLEKLLADLPTAERSAR